jgi:arsenate reductase
MKDIIFIEYPRCTTCQRAKAWLEAQGVNFTSRHIVENNPTAEELRQWIEQSSLPIKKWFNTSGMAYRALELKDKLPNMTEDEQIQLLASDGMLVKRPILIVGDKIRIGFKETAWKELF